MARHAWTSPLVSSLNSPKPDQLPNFSPEADRRLRERLFVRIDARSFPYEIRLVGFDDLGPLDQLPDDVKWRDEKLHAVVGEEVGYVERCEACSHWSASTVVHSTRLLPMRDGAVRGGFTH